MFARLVDPPRSVRPAPVLAIAATLFVLGLVFHSLSLAWLLFAAGMGLGVVTVAVRDVVVERRCE